MNDPHVILETETEVGAGGLGSTEVVALEETVKRTERERVLGLFEADLERWRSYAPAFPPSIDADTVLLCAKQVEDVIRRIREGLE